MAVLSMSKQEFGRLDVLLRVQSARLRVADACALIGLHRRQVFRLLVVSSRMVLPACFRSGAVSRAIIVIRLRFARWRCRSYASGMRTLVRPSRRRSWTELHGCSVSRETLRGWMIEDALCIDRRHRLASPHQPRRRRECLGELVQIDGSEHAWFESRGETCTLLAFVDDATNRLMQLRFVASESAFDYFRTTRAYLEAHGKPVAFYSDKHNIFRVNAKNAVGGPRLPGVFSTLRTE
jgi:hypothetical protein